MNKKISLILLSMLASSAMADNQFIGGYAGMGLGHISGEDNGKEYDTGVFDGWTINNEPSGSSIGIFGGFNWMLKNNMIIGVEASYESRNADDTNIEKNNGVPDPQFPVTTDVQSAMSLLARLGLLFNNDQTMAYVSAGVLSADIKRTFRDTNANPDFQTSKESQTGLSLGIGVEHFVLDNFSVRADLRSADLGKGTPDITQIYFAAGTQKNDYSETSFSIGASYYF